MQKILATDLDGTLFYPKRKIGLLCNKNVKFLQNFIDDGNRVCIVSGRNYDIRQKIESKIGRPVDIIGCNSSFIYCDNKIIKDKPFNNKELEYLIEDCHVKYRPLAVMFMTKNHSMIVDKKTAATSVRYLYKIWSTFQFEYEEKYILNSEIFREELTNGTIYKLILFMGPSRKAKNAASKITKDLRENYPNFEASWSGQIVEITPKGCSKAEGLNEYVKYLGVPAENIYVCGDSGNDISMFTSYPINSFCMEHSHYRVRKYARYTIGTVSEVNNYLD